jgi:hypothetical protein
MRTLLLIIFPIFLFGQITTPEMALMRGNYDCRLVIEPFLTASEARSITNTSNKVKNVLKKVREYANAGYGSYPILKQFYKLTDSDEKRLKELGYKIVREKDAIIIRW